MERDTDQSTDRPRSSLAVWLVVAAILVPVAYLLSTGPLIVFVSMGYRSVDSFELIYWPLSKLYDHWQPAHVFFDWYLGLWGRSP